MEEKKKERKKERKRNNIGTKILEEK